MLWVGKNEAAKPGITNIKFIEGIVEEMSFAGQYFNIVLSRLAFHHFTDIDRPFTEMSRVLKDGG